MNNLKEYKIIAPEGKVINEKALKEGKIEFIDNDPLEYLPESWEELGGICGEYLDEDSRILKESHTLSTSSHYNNNNIVPDGLGEAYRAHMMLSQLIYRYNGNCFVDWEDNSVKFGACFKNAELIKISAIHTVFFLAFKSEELRDKFINAPKIRELIEIAKPIL